MHQPHIPGTTGARDRSVVTGLVTGGGNGTSLQIRVHGETHDRVTSPTGLGFGIGTSVTVLRHGDGRFEVLGLAGHWAPRTMES